MDDADGAIPNSYIGPISSFRVDARNSEDHLHLLAIPVLVLRILLELLVPVQDLLLSLDVVHDFVPVPVVEGPLLPRGRVGRPGSIRRQAEGFGAKILELGRGPAITGAYALDPAPLCREQLHCNKCTLDWLCFQRRETIRFSFDALSYTNSFSPSVQAKIASW